MQVATASYAFDKKSARSYDADGRMRVRDCVISVAEVNPYYGKEIPRSAELGLSPNTVYDLYRDPDELARAADSFNGLPLMIRHVAQTADEPRKEYIGGSVFNARYDAAAGQLRADLLVMDKQAIDYIESGELADLSSSYRYVADMTAGDADGRKYDGVMRNIEGNHVALVEDGRATGAHVADSALSSQAGVTNVENETPEMDVAKALMLLSDKLEGIEDRLSKIEGKTDEGLEMERAELAGDEQTEKDREDEREGEEKYLARERKDREDEREGEEKFLKKEHAMDAKSVQALVNAAVAAERKRAQDVEQAKRATRTVLGDVIAMDSAPDIYRAALKQAGMDVSSIAKGTEQLAWNAFQSATSAARPAVHAMDRAPDSGKSAFDTSHIRVRG